MAAPLGIGVTLVVDQVQLLVTVTRCLLPEFPAGWIVGIVFLLRGALDSVRALKSG